MIIGSKIDYAVGETAGAETTLPQVVKFPKWHSLGGIESIEVTIV